MKLEFQLLLAAQILFRGIALIFLIKRGLLRNWWPLYLFLLLGEFRQIPLLAASGSMETYRPVYRIAQMVNAPMVILLAWSAIDGVSRHYKNPYPTTLVVGVLGSGIGAAGAWGARHIGDYAKLLHPFGLRVERFGWETLLVGVLLGLLCFSHRKVALSYNSQVHGVLTICFFVVAVIGRNVMLVASVPVGTWIEGLGACVYYLGWGMLMRVESATEPVPLDAKIISDSRKIRLLWENLQGA